MPRIITDNSRQSAIFQSRPSPPAEETGMCIYIQREHTIVRKREKRNGAQFGTGVSEEGKKKEDPLLWTGRRSHGSFAVDILVERLCVALDVRVGVSVVAVLGLVGPVDEEGEQ